MQPKPDPLQVLSERPEEVTVFTNKNDERIFVAVDVMNIWYTGRYQFGDGTRINYAKLVDLLVRAFAKSIV